MIDRYRDGVVPEAEPAPALAADFDGLAETVPRRFDRVELTLALDEIWRRVRASTATWRTRRRGSSPRTRARPEQLDEVLYALAEGLRVVAVLLHRLHARAWAERLLAALGREDRSLDSARASARVRGGARDRRARPAVPEGRGLRGERA